METLKPTPIDQLEDLADGVPVLAVEGIIKVAMPIKHSPPTAAHPWTKQFFVLSSGTAEIACSMWDAEDSEMTKGEKVRIENTQNRKGQWNGMVKGSYMKDNPSAGEPERKHTLEIRCNQVKITQLNGVTSSPTIDTRKPNNATPTGPRTEPEHADPEGADWPEAPVNAPQSPPTHPETNGGVTEARKHLMKSANLYNLCVAAVDKAIAPNMPNIAQTSEQFQAAVGTLFIEASRAGFVSKMPEKPI